MSIKPNFFVVGAPKAGTTSLYHYLKEHPEIFISNVVKEANYFALNGKKPLFSGPGDMAEIGSFSVWSKKEYLSLFSGAQDYQARGDVSPWYLYSSDACNNIKKDIPSAKIIIIIREPVDRAYSQYTHFKRVYREPLNSFEEAAKLGVKRVNNGWEVFWDYYGMSFYADSILNYQNSFGANQVLVLLQEDLISEPEKNMKNIYGFLGVDNEFVPDFTKKYNAGGVSKSKRLHDLTRHSWVKFIYHKIFSDSLKYRVRSLYDRFFISKAFKLSDKEKKHIQKKYLNDIAKVEKLTNLDLSHWLY